MHYTTTVVEYFGGLKLEAVLCKQIGVAATFCFAAFSLGLSKAWICSW